MSSSALSVDMRHTKLSAADAALIAGEVTKPSWASRNEGIHERISFDDTLWGFELAGGSFYKTPLRVVYVKAGSRAEMACIKKGDTVKRINDIDTSTLTLQEAHDIIVESGIHLKISVTSPDDEDDAYYTYEDAIVDEAALAEQLRKEKEAERIRRAIERANRASSYPWPWVKRTNIIYRESNCFLVPSKYENLHKEKYPELPHIRYTDDISSMIRGTAVDWNNKPKQNGIVASEGQEKGLAAPESQKSDLAAPESQEKGFDAPESQVKGQHATINEDSASVMDEKEANKIINEILEEGEEVSKNIPSDVEEPSHSDADDTAHSEMNGEVIGPDSEEEGLVYPEKQEVNDNIIDELESIENNETDTLVSLQQAETEKEQNEESSSMDNNVGDVNDNPKNLDKIVDEVEVNPPASDYVNEDDLTKSEEDNVVDGIVGDGDIDSTNER